LRAVAAKPEVCSRPSKLEEFGLALIKMGVVFCGVLRLKKNSVHQKG
jgi:hypothetical protein